MILGVAAYSYVQHTAPVGPVRDFLNSNFLKMYCADSLSPLIINRISAEDLEEMISNDADGWLEQQIPMVQLHAAIEWLRSLPRDENTIIAVIEG